MPTAIDLFCGCGGLTQGLVRAGFDVIGAIEIDDLAARTYRLNHPAVSLWSKDIRKVSVRTIKRRLHLRCGELDLLAGCPPCEGFSSIRTHNGSKAIEDPRNRLILQFLRLAKGLKPKAIMLENVPALRRDRRFGRFVRELKALGYQCDHALQDAADYGVPQRRHRLILMAGHGFSIPFPRPSRYRRTVRNAIGNLPAAGESGDPIHDFPENRRKTTIARIRRIPQDGGSRGDLSARSQLPCHRRCDGFSDVYGRMAWDDVAPTLTSGCFNPSKGRFLHPEANRAITMREAALLQTFPKYYHFPCDKGKLALALLIGNALPPRFVRAHAAIVLRILKKAARNPA